MDYSLLLGIHYPSRVPYKVSMDAAGSTSVDGLPSLGLTGSFTEYRVTSDSDGEGGHYAATGSGAVSPLMVDNAAALAMGGSGPLLLGDRVSGGGATAAAMSGVPVGLTLADRMTSEEYNGVDRARNWEVYSNAAELEARLSKIQDRMRSMGFSEQRMKVRDHQGCRDVRCAGYGC